MKGQIVLSPLEFIGVVALPLSTISKTAKEAITRRFGGTKGESEDGK